MQLQSLQSYQLSLQSNKYSSSLLCYYAKVTHRWRRASYVLIYLMRLFSKPRQFLESLDVFKHCLMLFEEINEKLNWDCGCKVCWHSELKCMNISRWRCFPRGARSLPALRLAPKIMAVFILEDALCVWTNLDKHSLFVWLFVSGVKTGTRCIIFCCATWTTHNRR